MAWIKTVDESDATGLLKQVYEASKKRLGRVSGMLQGLSLNPEAARAVAQLGFTIQFGNSRLTRAQEEMIGVVVSSMNKCSY